MVPSKNSVQTAGIFGDRASDTADQRSTFGVFKESETDDVDVLVNNYTAPALARALRERETTLHNAAHLVETGNMTELSKILRPFLKTSIDKRRKESFEWDISDGLTRRELILVQRQLHRMPREVFQATSRRASVVIPLCNVSGTARKLSFFVEVYAVCYTWIDTTMLLSSSKNNSKLDLDQFLFVVCMHACIYVSIHLCIYVSMSPYMYVSMYLCIYVCMCPCIYVSMYVCKHVSMYLCVYVYVHICLFICVF